MAIAFFDFDGTLLDGDSGLLGVWPCWRRGIFSSGALARFVAVRAAYGLGVASREHAYRVGFEVFRGATEERLEQTASWLYEELYRPRLSVVMRDEVERRRDAGDRLVILTLSLAQFAEPLAREWSFDRVVGTRVEFSEGVCTGRLAGSLVDGAEKLIIARGLCEAEGVALSACAFYSDGLADRPLLEAVGSPVAVGSDRRLSRLARARGWRRLAHAERGQRWKPWPA